MSTTTTSRNGNDQHGNPISATDDAIALYDRAVDRLARYHPDVVTHATTLAEEHPDAAMGQALVAYLHLSSTQRPDAEVARAAWQAMSASPMTAREQAHHDAIGAWVRGSWQGAAQILDDLLLRWPTDLLALQMGHQLDFFVGDATNLRDRPGRSLHAFDPADPHAALVRGMQAFGLEECGHYEAAEDAGLAAVSVNPDDVWAIHAVTHTYEMRGLVDQGVKFLTAREADWGGDNLFSVHSWWHLALFRLEVGDLAGAMAIYDREVHHQGSDGVALEMLDASALLWRFHLDGLDTGGRFDALADAWTPASNPVSWYVFNDVHATMALVGAGRVDGAKHLVARLTRFVEAGGSDTNVAMATEIGLPACRALVAFAEERWDDVTAGLAPIRRRLQLFGGSHAQRDVLQRTVLEAALRSGQVDLARALISERLALRDTSSYAWAQRTRLQQLTG